MDFDGAVKAHAAWKVNLRAAIHEQKPLDVDTIARDDCCDLGRWLHGEAKQHYSSLPNFVPCVTTHARFHKEAAFVASIINEGEYEVAESLLKYGTPYALASGELAGLLGRLRHEYEAARGRGRA